MEEVEKAIRWVQQHAATDKCDTSDFVLASLHENAQLRAVITQSDPDFFKRKCRVCGCDWNHACEGGCSWVADDLCSKCYLKPEAGATDEN